jgi:dephospho-CoA kinase
MTSHLIGVSGKIGSGKNYFADEITKFLVSEGYTVGESAFATPLKQEATEIINDFFVIINKNYISKIIELYKLAKKHNMQNRQMRALFSFVSKEVQKNPKLSGYSRSEGVRRFLQYLGTDIRRKKKESYWTDKFKELVPNDCDFVFVTDVRFINEADCVIEGNGTIVRVEVAPHVIRERVIGRDGLLYSAEALAHPSENALDNYKKFDFIVGEVFDVIEIGNQILSRASNVRK